MNSTHHSEKQEYILNVLFLSLVFCIHVALFGQNLKQSNNFDKKYFLDMKGHVKNEKNNLPLTTIVIFSDSVTKYFSMESDVEGCCAFALPLQAYYVIKFIRQGYVTKTITVDTHTSREKEADYLMAFTVNMFEQISDLDIAMLKEPIAKIYFNTRINNFYYDKNYSDMINKQVKGIYLKYYITMRNEKNIETSTPFHTDEISSSKQYPTKAVIASDLPYTSANSRGPVPKVVFCIQLLASDEPRDICSFPFQDIPNVKEYKEGDLYKYYTGSFPSYIDAQILQEVIRECGFKDAFIIAFDESKKVNVGAALDKTIAWWSK